MPAARRAALYAGWQEAVARLLHAGGHEADRRLIS
jgi:hypothetical protein